MSKFTFIREEEASPFSHNSKSTTEFEAFTLEDILYHFEDFLRGAGFPVNGELSIVDKPDSTTSTETMLRTMADDHLGSISTDTFTFASFQNK